MTLAAKIAKSAAQSRVAWLDEAVATAKPRLATLCLPASHGVKKFHKEQFTQSKMSMDLIEYVSKISKLGYNSTEYDIDENKACPIDIRDKN